MWTTNFDGLTGKAGTAFAITPVEIGIDCQGASHVYRGPGNSSASPCTATIDTIT